MKAECCVAVFFYLCTAMIQNGRRKPKTYWKRRARSIFPPPQKPLPILQRAIDPFREPPPAADSKTHFEKKSPANAGLFLCASNSDQASARLRPSPAGENDG